MTAFVHDAAPVYLLALLSKGDHANFSPKEIAVMKRVTSEIKQAFRAEQSRG